MKKNIATVLLGAAVLTLFAGCNKEQISGNELPSQAKFTATIENPATKVTLNRTAFGGKIEWKDGDIIVINEQGQNYRATPQASNPTIAEFTSETHEATPIDGYYYAWYPYNLLPENSETFVLNEKAIYSANDLALSFPMYAVSNTKQLDFKNICGVIEITLKGSKPIDRIEVKDAEKAMSGAFTVDDNFNAVITDPATKASRILLCNNSRLTEEGVAFYIPVPPATYNKLTVTVYSGDGFTWEITAKAPATIERSMIYPLQFTPDLGNGAHEVVQLWENGPYWATQNIGATSATDPGLYFRWAEQNGYRLVLDGDNSYYIGKYPTLDFAHETWYDHSLDFANLDLAGADKDLDAARVLWGEGWRMPTKDEIEALKNLKPTVEEVIEDGATVGFKYTTEMGSVTFAKSGILNKATPSGGLGSSGNGYIWTSTKANPGSSHDVFRADIKSAANGGISTKSNREYNGIPIRPVRDTPLN